MNDVASPFNFWSSAAPWLALMAFAATVALLHARPTERSQYLNTLWLFLLGLGGEAAASLVWALNFPDAAGTVHAIARFVASMALIRQFGFFGFRLLLPAMGSHPPRIAEVVTMLERSRPAPRSCAKP